jgi:hypothetical protein
MAWFERTGWQSLAAFDRQDARLAVGHGHNHRCQFGSDGHIIGGHFSTPDGAASWAGAVDTIIRHGPFVARSVRYSLPPIQPMRTVQGPFKVASLIAIPAPSIIAWVAMVTMAVPIITPASHDAPPGRGDGGWPVVLRRCMSEFPWSCDIVV